MYHNLGWRAKGYFLFQQEVMKCWIFPKELIICWDYYGSRFYKKFKISVNSQKKKKNYTCYLTAMLKPYEPVYFFKNSFT